ncbi:DUF4136 domain-containing protein [Hymenobacter busanensis]|nr:DUF4136 domain-containing protein [Hymenobacter busanensis]QHJ07865.1 DUF4136 domain-containing protein [Hymenobacter busanensis]
MKLRLTSLWAFCLAVLLGSCSPAVNVEQRSGVDFSQYRTFAIAETEVKTQGTTRPVLTSSITDATIAQAIESEMAKRGITRTEGQPDFFVSTHLYVEDAERVVANPTGPSQLVTYPYLVRYRGALIPVNYSYWYTPAYSGSHTETYQEGTMVLDIIDAKTNNLVWRGTIIDPLNDPSRLGKQFAEAARDILDKFPVEKK